LREQLAKRKKKKKERKKKKKKGAGVGQRKLGMKSITWSWLGNPMLKISS
jgi:hypothetical protein